MLAAMCLTLGASVGVLGAAASPAAAAGPAFSPNTPTVLIAQGSPTQLEQAVESNGTLVFQPVGSAAGFRYNGIAYDTTNNYLYGVIISGRPNTGDIIQIDATGQATDTGINTGGTHEDVGVFDSDNGEIYFGSSLPGANKLFVFNPATNATSTLKLSTAPRAADFAYSQGYLWGIGQNGIVRVDPTTGTVSSFTPPPTLLPGSTNPIYGAAWTYGNGNLGFSNDASGDIYQIAISNPSAASPTFSLISSQPGPANSNNDGASIPGANVDLALSKTASPTTASAGGQITYTLTVTNNGPGNSSGYLVSDPLPPTLVNPQTSTAGCSIAALTLTCHGNALAKGASATITFTADAPTPDTAAITNTATVTGNENDPNPSNNTATATVQPPAADLALVKTAAPTTVAPGGQVTYTLLVTNNGPSDASDVSVSDALPAGETLVSAVPSQGTCSVSACQLGTVLNGGQAQILLTVDVGTTVSGTVTNTASVSSATTPDPNQANNTSSSTVTVTVTPPTTTPTTTPTPTPVPRTTQPSADLQIVKRVNHTAAAPGQLLTYTMVVTNHGPDSATGVKVTDTPRLSVTDVHAKPSQGSCTVGKTLTCSLGTIANGKTATIVVTEKVLKPGTEINSASVTSASNDPKGSNNLSHAKTHVVAPAPKLSLSKTASPKKIGAGGRVTYRIKVSASGATARGLKVCDALPLGLTFISASPATALSNGRECWTIHSLAAGKSRTLILHAKALISTHGTLINHATATATGTKTARASAKLTVIAAATPTPPTGVTG